MKARLRDLEKRIGHRFLRRSRLEMALTHRSYRYENEGTEVDNQRLEFLGDAALGLVAAAHLYATFPDLQEGELTKLRSHLTSSVTLARAAEDIGLGEFLLLGRGELQTGGQARASNLTDALEAVIGAAYLDGGLRAVRKIFQKVLMRSLDEPTKIHAHENPKGRLQELVQQRWRLTPKYRLISETGPSHERVYTVQVLIQGHAFGTGSGNNKRAAEMEAARTAFSEVEPLTTLPESAQ